MKHTRPTRNSHDANSCAPPLRPRGNHIQARSATAHCYTLRGEVKPPQTLLVDGLR
jgi:hypothetical protein